MLWLVGESYILIEGACMKLILGDCLLESEQIESGSVDLILTDLPYGTMTDISQKAYKSPSDFKWDNAIDPIKVFNIANRILRKNGKMVLFSQEPYTSQLITHAIPNVPFSYRMMWEKDSFGNVLMCNKAPVGMFEDVLVFSKNYDTEELHPLRNYGIKCQEYISKSRKERLIVLGNRGSDHFLESKNKPLQFSLCTESIYNKLVEVFHIDRMEGFKLYSELKKIDNEFKAKYKSTFNLWEGNKYKSNILKYKKDYTGLHPTQKPILLLEDLIKTFSNEGDLVVDLTMGSGSTGVACKNTNRDFIGIEKDEGYFKIAEKRIREAKYTQLGLLDTSE